MVFSALPPAASQVARLQINVLTRNHIYLPRDLDPSESFLLGRPINCKTHYHQNLFQKDLKTRATAKKILAIVKSPGSMHKIKYHNPSHKCYYELCPIFICLCSAVSLPSWARKCILCSVGEIQKGG